MNDPKPTGLYVALPNGEPAIIELLTAQGEAEHTWTWCGGELLLQVIWQGEQVGELSLWTKGPEDSPRLTLAARWTSHGVELRLRNHDTGDNASMMAG